MSVLKKLLRNKKVSPAALMGVTLPYNDEDKANERATKMFWNQLDEHNREIHLNKEGVMGGTQNFPAFTNYVRLICDDLALFKSFKESGYNFMDNPVADTSENVKRKDILVDFASRMVRAQTEGQAMMYIKENGYDNAVENPEDISKYRIGTVMQPYAIMQCLKSEQPNDMIQMMQNMGAIKGLAESTGCTNEAYKYDVTKTLDTIENHTRSRREFMLGREYREIFQTGERASEAVPKLHGIFGDVKVNLDRLYDLQKTGDTRYNVNPKPYQSTGEERVQEVCNNLSSQITSLMQMSALDGFYAKNGSSSKQALCYLPPNDCNRTKQWIKETSKVLNYLDNEMSKTKRRLPELPDDEDELPIAQEYDIAFG